MDWKLIRIKLLYWFMGLVVGVVCSATLGWARQIDVTKAGISLWIFLAVGVCIILLQAVPALILISAFLGQYFKSQITFKKDK
jgi:uncharacterized membrane protein YhiD involved in acid resistance